MYNAVYKCGDCGSRYSYQEYERLRWLCSKCRNVIENPYIDEDFYYYIDGNRFNNIDNILEDKRNTIKNKLHNEKEI